MRKFYVIGGKMFFWKVVIFMCRLFNMSGMGWCFLSDCWLMRCRVMNLLISWMMMRLVSFIVVDNSSWLVMEIVN